MSLLGVRAPTEAPPAGGSAAGNPRSLLGMAPLMSLMSLTSGARALPRTFFTLQQRKDCIGNVITSSTDY